MIAIQEKISEPVNAYYPAAKFEAIKSKMIIEADYNKFKADIEKEKND